MLKGKRSVSACSLSSCRIRAEALARAFNTRIWPCVWLAQRSSSAERNDGMSNGIDDEEEFFDASPSPVEVEDESVFCQQHSSAATEAGRAKLYELLQQHAADDAIDVFYDVSEDAGLTNTASDTCLKGHGKESEQLGKQCQSSECCRQLDDESYFSNNSDSNEKDSEEVICFSNNQSRDEPVENEQLCSPDSGVSGKCQQISPCAEVSITCNSICADSYDNTVEKELENSKDRSEHPVKKENMVLEQTEKNLERDEEPLSVEHSNVEKSMTIIDNVVNETEENNIARKSTEITDLPSVDSSFTSPVADNEENCPNDIEQESKIQDSLTDNEITHTDKENKFVVEIVTEIECPSPTTSDEASVKTPSPTSRLKVFDELRPKISRSTSLKTGKTPPGTPSKKKIVRFADVLGLDLEDVRHIMTGDVPIIPSSAYTDLNLKDGDLSTCEPISETVEISRRDSSTWKTVQGATAMNALYPMFAIPGNQPDFMDRVRFQGVCLETVIVSEMNIQCTCRVMNYGFHKKVIARYTVNDWLSSNEIDASYVLGSSNGETDSFAFTIFLSPQNRNVKFALKYTVNNREYWDNNRHENYCLGYHGNDHMQHLPSPSWQHQFW